MAGGSAATRSSGGVGRSITEAARSVSVNALGKTNQPASRTIRMICSTRCARDAGWRGGGVGGASPRHSHKPGSWLSALIDGSPQECLPDNSLAPVGVPGRTRTCDPQFRNLTHSSKMRKLFQIVRSISLPGSQGMSTQCPRTLVMAGPTPKRAGHADPIGRIHHLRQENRARSSRFGSRVRPRRCFCRRR
jgi:hypothetical protein